MYIDTYLLLPHLVNDIQRSASLDRGSTAVHLQRPHRCHQYGALRRVSGIAALIVSFHAFVRSFVRSFEHPKYGAREGENTGIGTIKTRENAMQKTCGTTEKSDRKCKHKYRKTEKRGTSNENKHPSSQVQARNKL